jgi:hypothetical protein
VDAPRRAKSTASAAAMPPADRERRDRQPEPNREYGDDGRPAQAAAGMAPASTPMMHLG